MYPHRYLTVDKKQQLKVHFMYSFCISTFNFASNFKIKRIIIRENRIKKKKENMGRKATHVKNNMKKKNENHYK